jgi:putative ABC transport system substrate-binding protein
MNRREAITVLAGGAAAAWPLAARAQQATKIPRVGYVFSFIPSEGAHLWEACRQGLRELGYVEGKNIVLEPRWAEGRHERLPGLVADLVQREVDVIVAAATPASRAAKAATNTIPIVIVAVGDPVRVGLVASLVRPGGNVTGLSLLTSDLSGKRLELLIDVLPRLARVTVLMNPNNAVSAVFLEETQAAARSVGIELVRLDARDPRTSSGHSRRSRRDLPAPSSCSTIPCSGATGRGSWRWRPRGRSRRCTGCGTSSTTAG